MFCEVRKVDVLRGICDVFVDFAADFLVATGNSEGFEERALWLSWMRAEEALGLKCFKAFMNGPIFFSFPSDVEEGLIEAVFDAFVVAGLTVSKLDSDDGTGCRALFWFAIGMIGDLANPDNCVAGWSSSSSPSEPESEVEMT